MEVDSKVNPEWAGGQAGRLVGRERSRATSSTYDFVKIRVWLGEGHSHVLSRFLLSRTLTASMVPFETAVKVSLEVKKCLVDADMLEVTQAQLEETTFRFLRQRRLGEEVVERFRLLSAFHQRRQPLLVLICGSSRTSRSLCATQLAERLNLSNVLNTDWVHRILTQRSKSEPGKPPLDASQPVTHSSVQPTRLRRG